MLSPLRLTVEQVPEFYQKYSLKLDPRMRNCQHNSKVLIKKMEDGYQRHYLKIVSYREGMKCGNGLVFFNVDH